MSQRRETSQTTVMIYSDKIPVCQKQSLTFTDEIISKQTTLRESWIQKLQSSCVHDQNAITSQIFLPAWSQMKWKW